METTNNKNNSLTKREFLKHALSVCFGISAIPLFHANSDFFNFPEKSRIIVARSEKATENNKINGTVVKRMLTESLCQLTGESSMKQAWLKLIPNLRERNIIGIKINTVMGQAIPTQPKLVDAITSSLIELGVNANNIIIYDMWKKNLTDAGYILNKSIKGVRCIGNDDEGWGYDHENYVQYEAKKIALSRILLQCDHLINVPVLRVHMDPYGVTLSLKNHFGSIEKPQEFHADHFVKGCTALNNHPAIKEKQCVNIIDCLYGFWGSVTTAFVRDLLFNGLVVSKDPVAADYMGARILNEERIKHNRLLRPVPLLDFAAKAGLGTNDPKKMEIRNIVV